MGVEKAGGGRAGEFVLCLVGAWHAFGATVQGFWGWYNFFDIFLNGSNIIRGYVGHILGGENGCGCKEQLMGAGRCVRALLGGCLPDFWWGDQGVLGFGYEMGSIFWVFGMCGF